MSPGEARVLVPYPSDEAGPIDRWSERVYAALKDWKLAGEGRWTRWDPDYLVLSISQFEGADVSTILLNTANEELTVEFGGWHVHDPAPHGV